MTDSAVIVVALALAVLAALAGLWAVVSAARAPRAQGGPRPGVLAAMFVPVALYSGALVLLDPIADSQQLLDGLVWLGPLSLAFIAILGWRQRRKSRRDLVLTGAIAAAVLTVFAYCVFVVAVAISSLQFDL